MSQIRRCQLPLKIYPAATRNYIYILETECHWPGGSPLNNGRKSQGIVVDYPGGASSIDGSDDSWGSVASIIIDTREDKADGWQLSK